MKRLTAICIAIATTSLLQCLAAESTTINVTGAHASRVILSFRKLSGLELVIASNVKRAEHTPVTVETSHTKPLERDQAAKLIERALLEQAGIIITRLDDKRASVTYNDALPVKRVELKKATDK